MQDRYVGDIGDFGKYGLLNEIWKMSGGSIRLGVNWYYVTAEEHNGDGNHITYLNDSNKDDSKYRECFPELYDKLLTIVNSGKRSITNIENESVLPRDTIFYSNPLPYSLPNALSRGEGREKWFEESLTALEKSNILFLDPDNGIQPYGVDKTQPNAIKYALRDEIKRYYESGKTLVIYNHRDRRPQSEYERKILAISQYIKSWNDIKVLRFKRGSVRDYIFLIQKEHHQLIDQTIDYLTANPRNFLFEHYALTEVKAMTQRRKYWTNPSVLKLAGDSDPIQLITKKAREVVLGAIQEGWQGPPFDPFKLAEYLKIPITPREDVHEAHTLSIGSRGLTIEFNPNRPHGRVRFSVAHEIAHTLFPDCAETVRNRRSPVEGRKDDWQLELLCNIAASEFLMPIGIAMGLEKEKLGIDNVLRLRKVYDVSTEAISLRLIKVTDEPCMVFAAARISDNKATSTYRLDYNVPSRSCKFTIEPGFEVQDKTVLSECTAVGYTAKGKERWASSYPELYLECVGIPPYPGQSFPRIVGIAYPSGIERTKMTRLNHLRGDALEPRASGKKIIAHIVNDRTPRWGGGFALEVRRKWANVQDDFIHWASTSQENLSLGNIHISEVTSDLTIVNMIAQHGYGPSMKPRIRYQSLRNCLEKLAEIAHARGASVHMPRIGTGQSGGSWGIIMELLDDSLVQHGIEVTVYDLPNVDPIREMQGSLDLTSQFAQRSEGRLGCNV